MNCDEERIRQEYKRVKRSRLWDDRFMVLARKFKRPIREIKRIVGHKPPVREAQVGVLLKGHWVFFATGDKRSCWRRAEMLEQGKDSFFRHHIFEFAWVFDLNHEPLPFDEKPNDVQLRGAWVRLKDIPKDTRYG